MPTAGPFRLDPLCGVCGHRYDQGHTNVDRRHDFAPVFPMAPEQ